jgi:hypothetical protein
MPSGHEPAERVEGGPTVVVLDDGGARERVGVGSYEDAVAAVKERRDDATAVKIETRDGDVVFSTADGHVEEWERVWAAEKRRLSVEYADHDCPHDNHDCFPDDPCVDCQIDAVRERS